MVSSTILLNSTLSGLRSSSPGKKTEVVVLFLNSQGFSFIFMKRLFRGQCRVPVLSPDPEMCAALTLEHRPRKVKRIPKVFKSNALRLSRACDPE